MTQSTTVDQYTVDPWKILTKDMATRDTMWIHEKYWLRIWPPKIQCGSIPPWHELIVATKNTQWSYEMIKHNHGPIQYGSMWQSIYQHAQMISFIAWKKKITEWTLNPGSLSQSQCGTNLAMWINDLMLNMVETTGLWIIEVNHEQVRGKSPMMLMTPNIP